MPWPRRAGQAGAPTARSPAREVRPIQLPPRRNRHVLTLLSSLWPGLGQLAVGARRSALVLALPPLVLAALVIGALVSPDRLSRIALLIDPSVIAGVLVVELLFLAWRLGAVLDAFRRGDGRIGGRASVLTAIGLLFVLVPSVYGAYLTEIAREAASQVFSAVEGPQGWHPTTTPPPDPEFGNYGTPAPSAPNVGRFTVLFLGSDYGPGRDHALTDTMIVASLDPLTDSVSMVSIPRDTVDMPLPDGRVFHGKINTLASYANGHPQLFPGAPSGQTVLADTLGAVLGVRVNGWVEVNLPGFVDVVNSLHGIDVSVHDAFCDPTYHDYGYPNGFAVGIGRYHFNGNQALAYARVRKAAGESDFTRAARQQEIIVALRDRVVNGGFVSDPTGFIQSFGNLVRTNLAPADLLPYVDAASKVSRDHIYRDVVTYPLIRYVGGDPRGWIVVPVLDKIHDLGARAFPPAGTAPAGLDTIPADDGVPRKSGPTICADAPKPTANPGETLSPSAGPSGEPSPAPTDAPAPDPTPAPSPTAKPGGGGGQPTPMPTVTPSGNPGP